VSTLGLDIPIQRGFGDFQRPADFLNWVFLIVEILGNNKLSAGEGFGSATFASSGSGCCQSCLCPLPDQVSLKLCQCAKDMED
jgi:hypothetical protein